MSKAFTKETDAETELEEPDPLPAHVKNLVTPTGLAALQNELQFLLREERPKIVEIVSWAAGNGDRSENGDYIYNKKRLREIDRRVRYLSKRLEALKVAEGAPSDRGAIFFGAVFEIENTDSGETVSYRIVGPDETDAKAGWISIDSPLARAMLKKRIDDELEAALPGGNARYVIVDVRYGDDSD